MAAEKVHLSHLWLHTLFSEALLDVVTDTFQTSYTYSWSGSKISNFYYHGKGMYVVQLTNVPTSISMNLQSVCSWLG